MIRSFVSGVLAVAVFASSAFAMNRTLTVEDLEAYEELPYDTGEGQGGSTGTGSNGAGECQRGCSADYQSCIGDADEGAQTMCGSAYQELLAGIIDRTMYENIMDTCYGAYEADAAFCTESYGMCQEGCQYP